MRKTLFDKVWDNHVVESIKNGPDIFFVDKHLIHEVTSPQAFDELKEKNLEVFDPERLIFTSSIVNADEEKITKEKINQFYNSVVSIDSKVPQEARTSRSLGTTRQGSGVIIDNNNILTIGYIVIEASEIIIGLPNGKKIPGKLTGYDHSSGFGIVSPIIRNWASKCKG